MKKIMIFLSLLLIFSCSDKNTITEINNKSNLTIKVVDLNGNPINKALVTVTHLLGSDQNGSIMTATIFSDSTNDNGTASLGEVLEGDYSVTCYATYEGKKYYAGQGFQIVAGTDRNINLSPLKNIVKRYRILIVNKQDEPLSDINVAFISHSFSGSNYLKFSEIIKDAYWIEKTDIEGIATFVDVPTNFSYSAFIYRDSTRFEYPQTGFSASYSSNPIKYSVNL